MNCEDLVTRKPVTARETESVRRVAMTMRLQEIGFVPVLDPEGRVSGVVTDRDLALRVVADGICAETPVGEIMTTGEIISCRPEDDLAIAESRMRRWKVSRLVIMDSFRHCLGVLSLSDLARSGDPLLGGRALAAISSRATQGPMMERR